MDEHYCDTCYWCRVDKGIQRGSVDCDPPEWYCELKQYDYFFAEVIEDEDGNGNYCPKYSERDY